MNIGIIGYGRMGKEIEKAAKERNHNVPVIIDVNNKQELNTQTLSNLDVAIEFTTPDSAFENYKVCFDANVPVVSGTTGWLERMDELKSIIKQKNGAFFYAANFNIGVNIFFELNKMLASLMNSAEGYRPEIRENHHVHKIDAPSGTAIKLAENIIHNNSQIDRWVKEEKQSDNELPVKSIREDEIPGIHQVHYESAMDEIEIKHSAKSRKGFALGAILAAEFISDKEGYYEMKDMLQF